MVGSFENDTNRMESNGPGELVSRIRAKVWKTYPITLSYCCWRMFGDTLHSTWPELRVTAKACAISSWIDWGMFLFWLAGPIQISVGPLCSNSLWPSCVSSAPETSDRTTLVGNRSSRAASTPSVWVVLTRMQVCWGVTTESITEARS